MNAVSLVDLIAAVGSIAALGFLIVGSRPRPLKPEITLFAFILILTISHDIGNFMEWADLSNWFDPVEDYMEVLTAGLWAFFFYTYLQELTESKLREVQELDEKILDGSPVAFVLRDADLKILKTSKAFEKVTGYDPASVLGRKTDEFMSDLPGKEELDARLAKVLQTGEPLGPTEVVAPSPVPRYIRENIFPVKDTTGKVINTLSVLEDITEQVRTEMKLREVQELDEKILGSSPVAFVLHDPEMRIVRVSSAYKKVTGFNEREVVARKPEEFMPPGPRMESIVRRLRYVREQGVQVGPQDIESPIAGRHLRETILPIFDSQRKVVNILSVLEDITEQKNAQDALEESEARYRMLFDGIHDGVVVHEMTEDGLPGRFLEVNRTFCAMTGYAREELLKMSPMDLNETIPMEDSRRIRSSLVEGASVSFERTLVTKAGMMLPCEMNAHSFQMGERRVILSVVRDITERKQAQDRIKSSLAEKETLLREIHHRVKNNLQVISGLLNLQSHYLADDGARSVFKESQNRIKTMALIHEELYQREDLSRINLAEYINGLARNLMASYSIQSGRISLVMDLEDADIALDTAIPCGLIVNEIVSNSLSHAFPGNQSGQIKIDFKTRDPGNYELTILDDGIGLPPELNVKETRTLGLRLITILAEQLGADLHIERNGGTVFRLTFQEYLEAGTEMY